MKKLYKLFAAIFLLLAVNVMYSQTAYVKWPLTSNQNPDTPVGNIQASQQSIGTGSGSYLLSIYNPYVANGQRLWTGNQGTGWIAGLPDYTRFIQFDASPTTGNNFTVQYLSFRYSDNPLGTDFNIIKAEVWYSIDGWNNKTQLHTTALNYLNTSVQTFSKSLNVLVPNGDTFSLRIYPYTINGGLAMTPSFATHKDVLIEGTTSPAENDTCNTNSIILNTGWNHNTNSIYSNPGSDQDVFWKLINAPMSNGAVNLNGPAWVINKHAAWAQPGTGSQYISAFQTFGSNLTNIGATDTPYVFQRQICVGKTTDLLFDINVLVDNRAVVKFVDANGNVLSTLVTLSSSSTNNFTSPTHVTQTIQNVSPGTYYLRIEVRNDHSSSAMGVNLQGTVAGSSETLINSLCCNAPGSSISGYKFEDIDNDGIKDLNESTLAGWTVTLTGNGTTLSSITDANGNYLFTGLTAGTYMISEASQTGWIAGLTGAQQSVTVGTNQAINSINFGNKKLASICGMKFNDLNGDGIKDLNEPGLLNWVVKLSYENAAGSTTVLDTTDANGNYCFYNLNPGIPYTISEINQTGWQQTFPSSPGTHIVTLTYGQALSGINFGNKVVTSIGSNCTDFENGTGGWTTNNAGSTIIQDGENHYLQTTDQSGASSFFNESKPLTGNWSELLNGGCGTLCWDVNYLFAGTGNDGSSQPNTITPYIAIHGNGFSAYFLTNNLITAGDGWHSYCAPLKLINPGDPLPSNSDGHWVMSVGTGADWNSMLANITKLGFAIDPTSYQGEKFGFDNICLNNLGDCGTSTEFCDSLNVTAVKTSPDDCQWSLSLNQPAILTGVSSIQIISLAPNQFTTGTGLGSNFQNWFTTGTNTYTSPSGTVTGGNLNNFFNLNLSYVTSPQVIVVNWLNELGAKVCSDTLRLNCEIPCATIEIDTVACTGSNYNLSYSFTNNATYSVSNVEYTVQGTGNVSIAPSTAQLSQVVLAGANSGLQNILISGAVPGDIVNILVKFNSPDGCCWCYETITVAIPTCNTVCDSLTVQAQGNPEDCCYSVSLSNNSSKVFSNVEFELLSGGMFSTVSTTTSPGWGFTNVFPNNIIKLVKFPLTGGIANGNYSNVLDMCIRQYSSPNQVVAVRWIKDGQVICTDTLMFECAPLEPKIDSCSQAINGTLTCLPNGTYKYDFRVQNNSNIMSTGYGIYPTTPGVTFSQTIFNVNIMPGQVSPVTSIIITGIGSGQNLCFQTAIFTVVQGQTAYNYCCHSDTMCVTTPSCGGKEDCTPPPSGMMGWWPGDNNANDISGFNNHGTPYSSLAYTNGKVAQSFDMNPYSILPEFIVVQDHSALNFGTGDLSIDAWVKTKDSRGILFIVDKRAGTENIPLGYSFYISAGKVGFQMGDGSSAINYLSTTSPVADGNWHFIAVTIERKNINGGRIYVDGTLVLTFNPTAVSGSITNQAKFLIGQRNISFAIPFNGQIDEVEIFNRALADTTIFRVFAAGSAGKCKPKPTSMDEEAYGSIIPQNYQLLQNYPNPFNPSSRIRYDLPRSSFVKISVYDILGKEIAVLVNEEKNSGSYDVTFDAAGLASGIYFYTIRTGEFSQTRKMILLR